MSTRRDVYVQSVITSRCERRITPTLPQTLRKHKHILGSCSRCAVGQRSAATTAPPEPGGSLSAARAARNAAKTSRGHRRMDRSAADIQDITVEEGLEPPLPTDPGWHLLEDKRGIKRWKEFDPEMQKQLDSMAKSRRTVARFTGFAMSEMDGSGFRRRCPPTQHSDRYEVHFPSLMMKDLITKRSSRIYRADGRRCALSYFTSKAGDARRGAV